MKKRATVIIALGIVLLMFVSCSTTGRYLYYHQDQETADKSTTVEGSLPLVSIQLSGRTLNWSEGGGNYITTYTFNFDNANAFADMLFDYIPLRDLGVSIPATLRRGDVRLTEYIDYMARIRNESYAWGVKVVDAKGAPRRMDPNILTCLNENVDAGHYLVLDADIIEHQWSSWFGLIPFKIVYEFSAVVYDNEGNKVVSRHYKHALKEMPGSKYEAQSYYDGLEIALEQVSERIVEDLEKLSAEPPEDSESFSKEAI